MSEVIGWFCAFVVLCIVLVFGFCSWGTVDAGHRGVVLRMGAVTGEIKGEGFYGKTPWLEHVTEMNVQNHKVDAAAAGASKDLQEVTAEVIVNLRLDEKVCAKVYQEIGTGYEATVVAPVLQQSIKAVMATFTAEELISHRETVRKNIQGMVEEKLTPMGFVILEVALVDIDFSKSFNAAIEAKVTAEQNALAAKNKLAQVEFEAKQKVAEARGKADSMTIESEALKANQQILQLRALEKWDGVLPKMMGAGAVPFIGASL